MWANVNRAGDAERAIGGLLVRADRPDPPLAYLMTLALALVTVTLLTLLFGGGHWRFWPLMLLA